MTMKAYNMSNESPYTLQERLDRLEAYSVGDLLYVLRDIEKSPGDYDKQIIKVVYAKLASKNIICI